MKQNTLTKILIALSAVMTILAGIIHLWVVPEHLEHAPAHGIFFLIVSIAQITWSIFVWRKPSETLYYIGALMSGWLIVLYAITRLFPPPFSDGWPEIVDLIGLVCELFEFMAMFTLLILIFRSQAQKTGYFIALLIAVLIVLLSFASSVATYRIARASEPLFPWLSSTGEEVHHDGSH
ncbi:MAG: hypothetical protein U0V02_11885 [Anaerolineales bacterium]